MILNFVHTKRMKENWELGQNVIDRFPIIHSDDDPVTKLWSEGLTGHTVKTLYTRFSLMTC